MLISSPPWGPRFRLPELAGLWMKRHANSVPNAEGEDLRPVPGPPHKGIVGGRGAVLIEPKDLTAVVVRVLRPDRVAQTLLETRCPDRHIKLAVGPEDDPCGGGAVRPGNRLEDLADIRELVALQTRSDDGRSPKAFGARLGLPVRHVHEPILREARVERDVHASRVSTRALEAGRQAGDGRRVEYALANEAKRGLALLGDQHVAIR